MIVDAVTVSPDTPAKQVSRILTDRHLHRVLVAEGTAVRGVITALDVVRLIADGRIAER
jgi:CBS domain-containing protein